MDSPSPSPEPRAPSPRRQALKAIAGELASPAFPRGELAALRRMDPDAPGSTPAFLKLLARHHPTVLGAAPDHLRRWALVLHGMALMAPDHHRTGEPVGSALFAAGYAEPRLARLLGARGAQFRALVPRLCRHLKSKDRKLDWRELAELVLTEERDEERAERCRLAVARAYYRREAAAPLVTAGQEEQGE